MTPESNDAAKEGDLCVWWVPQVPMASFYVPVSSLAEAKKLLCVLADYDAFQFENRVKGDYCNAGGLVIFENGEWLEWEDPETGNDIDTWTPPTEAEDAE